MADEKINQLEENLDPRDHRVIGRELDLFTFSDTVGKGLPLWTARGATFRRELERFVVDTELAWGYQHVMTPDIAKIDLYKKSGHYPYYKETMYAPIQIDEEEFMLRPMTCPHHFELYLSKPRSYRDLPMRIAELAKLYRYELSGVLTGLVRVRSFCLADAHIICADEVQMKSEIKKALDLIDYMAGVFGLKMGENYSYRLSLGDRANKNKYYDNDAAWDQAEGVLREVLTERKCDFVEAADEAAFYGPKIDIQMKKISGVEETAFTVQYDFVMPGRFNLKYTDKDGSEKLALVVHRSSIGAIERIAAFLLEHFDGALPVWLSPVQAAVLPISEKVAEYAKEIGTTLKVAGIRYVMADEAESLGKKIRNAEAMKTPYMLIVGEKEAASGQVSVRAHGQKDLGTMDLAAFVEKIKKEIETKALPEIG
ncbi:MAG: threonine--tRNA ligase [Microgenomates group bacterium]